MLDAPHFRLDPTLKMHGSTVIVLLSELIEACLIRCKSRKWFGDVFRDRDKSRINFESLNDHIEDVWKSWKCSNGDQRSSFP